MINLKHKKITLLMMVILAMILIFTGCGNTQTAEEPPVKDTPPATEAPKAEEKQEVVLGENPKVQIEMEDGGIMVLELYPEFAPETVENFVTLVKSGFYDGLTFHRIVKDFMIQGGDPKGNGTGGSDKNITGEFAGNGFKQNTLSHTKGVISMARSGNPNSASSQFFIVHGDASFLDGQYAAFGKLIEGEDTLDQLANTPVAVDPNSGEVSLPTEDVVIKRITVME